MSDRRPLPSATMLQKRPEYRTPPAKGQRQLGILPTPDTTPREKQQERAPGTQFPTRLVERSARRRREAVEPSTLDDILDTFQKPIFTYTCYRNAPNLSEVYTRAAKPDVASFLDLKRPVLPTRVGEQGEKNRSHVPSKHMDDEIRDDVSVPDATVQNVNVPTGSGRKRAEVAACSWYTSRSRKVFVVACSLILVGCALALVGGVLALVGGATDFGLWGCREKDGRPAPVDPLIHRIKTTTSNPFLNALSLPQFNHTAHAAIDHRLHPADRLSAPGQQDFQLVPVQRDLSLLGTHTSHLSDYSHLPQSGPAVQTALQSTPTLTLPLISSLSTMLDHHTRRTIISSSIRQRASQQWEEESLSDRAVLLYRCFRYMGKWGFGANHLNEHEKAEVEFRGAQSVDMALAVEGEGVERVLWTVKCLHEKTAGLVGQIKKKKSGWWEDLVDECTYTGASGK